MRKRILTHDELNQVIKLRQSHASWLKIQKETGVPRRSARRAYENWERNQTIEELKIARTNVAAEVFRDHLNDLTTLAVSLVGGLRVPPSPNVDSNAEQFFAGLWQQDLLHRSFYVLSETKETIRSPRTHEIRDPEFIRRENKMLFESLKVHTGDKVRWEALDAWKQARNDCVNTLAHLRQETAEIVNNFLKQETRTDLVRGLKEASGEDNPVECVAEAVLKAIWKALTQDKSNREPPSFETVPQGSGTTQETLVKSAGNKFFTFGDTSLAAKVAQICTRTANNLYRGDKSHLIESLRNEVHTMKRAVGKLEESLNPLVLTPLILRTRCDLCPA